MKPVKSRTVCDFFYILFWAHVIIAALIVILILFTMSMIKRGGYELFTTLLTQSAVLSIVVVNAMFTYIMCERALISPEK